jgi:hypothetical protein
MAVAVTVDVRDGTGQQCQQITLVASTVCTAAGPPPAVAVIVCLLPPPILLLLTPGRRARSAGCESAGPSGVRGTGHLTALVRESREHLTSAAPRSSAGRRQHEPGSRRLLSHHVSHTEESHACRRLLPRPPGPHLDRGHVRIRAGNTREPRPPPRPGQPADPCRPTAKDAGGGQRTRSHGRKRQRWGSLGQQLRRRSSGRCTRR